MNNLIHINYAFLQIDAKNKSINIQSGTEPNQWCKVVTTINGHTETWIDGVNQFVSDLCYNGDLKDCLRYLQSFQYKVPTDLNEIYHNETTKYEVA